MLSDNANAILSRLTLPWSNSVPVFLLRHQLTSQSLYIFTNQSSEGVYLFVFIPGHGWLRESSPVVVQGAVYPSPAFFTPLRSWNYDVLFNCSTGLRCYSLGLPHCLRSCLKSHSSVRWLIVDRGAGYWVASAVSAPPRLMLGLCALTLRPSMPLLTGRRSAPRPASYQHDHFVQKQKASSNRRSNWRKMKVSTWRPVKSRFFYLFC